MGKEHKLVFDFGLPWEYFSSAFQIKKKTSKKKKSKETTEQNKKNHYSKEEGIEHNSL